MQSDLSADFSTNKLRGVTPSTASKAAVGFVLIAPVALRQWFIFVTAMNLFDKLQVFYLFIVPKSVQKSSNSNIIRI